MCVPMKFVAVILAYSHLRDGKSMLRFSCSVRRHIVIARTKRAETCFCLGCEMPPLAQVVPVKVQEFAPTPQRAPQVGGRRKEYVMGMHAFGHLHSMRSELHCDFACL
jgi:hypothetical protein